MARLVIESGTDVGLVYPLTDPIITIGRSPANTIQIIDRKVSRYHSEIYNINNEYILRDLGSKNGTYVNDRLITGEYKLQNNDKLHVGDTVLVFELEALPEEEKDSTTRSVRLVAEPVWGETKQTMSVMPPSEIKIPTEVGAEQLIKDSSYRLEILYQVGEAIRNIFDISDLLNKLMEILFNVIQPDRACVLLKDEVTNQFVPQVVKTREKEEVALSRHIIEQCIKEKVSILVSDAPSDKRFEASDSVIRERIQSAMCSPLVYKDEVIGVIYVDTKSRLSSYGQEELELLTGISNQAAMAIVNTRLHACLVEQSKLEKELEIARNIQMNLLPQTNPAIENFEVAAISIPAKKVGGDYYDFIELPTGQLGVAVGDVSGKGVPAAILIATVRALLKIEATRPRASVPTIVSKVNSIICNDVTGNMFVTLVFGLLNPTTRTFEYTNAGHCHPLIFNSSKEITSLSVGGNFLGLVPDAEYRKDTAKLSSGSVLVIYTDGITDTMNENGELFGLERLKNVISSNIKNSAEAIRVAVLREIDNFRGKAEVFDDMTLVIIKSL